MKAEMGFEIGFIFFSIFYIGFLGWASAEWPGASDYIAGNISAPTMPAQPNVLDYLFFAIQQAWYFLTAYISFNIAMPVLGLISLSITLTMVWCVIRLIRGV
jgi:hypothetical protein